MSGQKNMKDVAWNVLAHIQSFIFLEKCATKCIITNCLEKFNVSGSEHTQYIVTENNQIQILFIMGNSVVLNINKYYKYYLAI